MSGRKGMRILWRRIGDGREISTFIIMIVLSERVWNGNGGSLRKELLYDTRRLEHSMGGL
jgi:hypothetical protein